MSKIKDSTATVNVVAGSYYLLVNSTTKEKSVVYCYINSVTTLLSFGFNAADGGGIIPITGISGDTMIFQLNINPVF